jgi:hypothetical protein
VAWLAKRWAHTKPAAPKIVAQAIFGSDLFFWALKTFVPSAFARLLGMPKRFHPTAAEQLQLDDREADLFPIAPRKHGALFDTYVTTPSVQGFPLEALAVPPSSSTPATTGFPRSTTRSKALPAFPAPHSVPSNAAAIYSSAAKPTFATRSDGSSRQE